MLKIFNFKKENTGKLKPVSIKGYIADGERQYPLFTTEDKILELTSFNSKKDKNSNIPIDIPIGIFEINNPDLMIGDYGIVIGRSLLSLNNAFQRKQLLSLIHMLNMSIMENPLWEDLYDKFVVNATNTSSSSDYGDKVDKCDAEMKYLSAAEKYGRKAVSKATARNAAAYNAAMKKAAKSVYKNAEKSIIDSIKEGVNTKTKKKAATI